MPKETSNLTEWNKLYSKYHKNNCSSGIVQKFLNNQNDDSNKIHFCERAKYVTSEILTVVNTMITFFRDVMLCSLHFEQICCLHFHEMVTPLKTVIFTAKDDKK